MADLTLRPLTLGELLDRAFTIFRQRAGALIVPLALGMAPALFMLVGSIGELLRFAEFSQRPGDPAAVEETFAFLSRFFGISLVGMLGFVWGRGAALHVALEAGQGRMEGTGPAMRASLARYPSQLGLAVVEAVLLMMVMFAVMVPFTLFTRGMTAAAGMQAVFYGFAMLVALFVVAGFFLAALFVSTAALLAEPGVGAFGAIDRSWKLTRGSRGRILALMLIVWVLSFMLLIALSVVFGVSGAFTGAEPSGAMTLASFGINILINLLVGAFYYVAQAVMYIDLRVRREGFDLEVLAGQGVAG